MQEGMDHQLYQLLFVLKEWNKHTKLRICSLGDQYFVVVVYDIILLLNVFFLWIAVSTY